MRPHDPLSLCTDEELLGRFRTGQQEAFGVLVRRYERELFGYLRRYIGDPTLADDVFQNTFLQVVTKSSQYQPGRPVRPWLYAIATHQAIDAMRRAGRKAAVSLDLTTAENEQGELRGLIELLEARTPGPVEQTASLEQAQMVRESVEKLPENLREIVILAYYQGLKYREVAEVLNIPVGTVKSRLHAALLKLHEAWNTAPSHPEL